MLVAVPLGVRDTIERGRGGRYKMDSEVVRQPPKCIRGTRYGGGGGGDVES